MHKKLNQNSNLTHSTIYIIRMSSRPVYNILVYTRIFEFQKNLLGRRIRKARSYYDIHWHFSCNMTYKISDEMGTLNMTYLILIYILDNVRCRNITHNLFWSMEYFLAHVFSWNHRCSISYWVRPCFFLTIFNVSRTFHCLCLWCL